MNKMDTKVATNVTNGTDLGSSPENKLLVPQIIVGLLILSTNIFIFYVFFNNKNFLKKTTSNRLILSLSVSHFLTGLVFLGKVIITPMLHFPVLKIENAKYVIIVDILMAFCIKATLLHLCGITLDRFISLFYALRYNVIVTVKKLNAYITFVWVIAFLASAIQLSWLYDYVFLEKMPHNEKMVMEIEKWYSVSIFVIVFTLILVLGVVFTLMFMEIRKILFRHQGISANKNLTRYNCKKQRRVLYTFGLMYLLFTLTTMPYFTVRLIFDLNLWKIPTAMFTIMGLFKETVAFLNPILYIIRNYEFRLASTKMCLSHRKSYQDKSKFGYENSKLLKVSIGKTVSVSLRVPDSRNTSPNLHVEAMV